MKPMSRREFSFLAVVTSAFAIGLDQVATAAEAVANRLGVLTQKQWQVVGLVMDEILPATEKSPSATQTGVLDFLENGFADRFWRFKKFPKTFPYEKLGYRGFAAYYRKLVQRIESLSQATFKKRFAALAPAQRTQVVTEFSKGVSQDVGYRIVGIPPVAKISDAELFDMAKRHCVQSFFAEPAHGGNRDYGGWKTISHTCHSNYPDRPDDCPSHLVED